MLPFHCTTELATKFAPATVSVKAGPPGTTKEGDREMTLGTGLLMAKEMAFDVPPAGPVLKTLTCAVPAVATSLPGIEACNVVLFAKPVVRSEPFQRTTEPEIKPLPLTVRVKASPPTMLLEGDREVSAGTGLPITRDMGLDTPPPGAGLETVT